MTPLRKHAVLRRVKDLTLGTTFSIALLHGGLLLQSCGSDRQDSQQTETRFDRGVRTFITETSPGQFKITDEVPADPDKAGAVVSYYDGHRDTLSVEAAKRLVQGDASTRQYLNNPAGYNHSSGLANVLLWGSLGYMLGRSTAPRYQQYENRYRSGVYASPSVFQRSSGIGERVASSRVSRPVGGRSGFFGRSRSRSFGS